MALGKWLGKAFQTACPFINSVQLLGMAMSRFLIGIDIYLTKATMHILLVCDWQVNV
jgi:hypothetical protein